MRADFGRGTDIDIVAALREPRYGHIFALQSAQVSGGPRIVISYRVYWQPGCTSCLRTKEFLRSPGIQFESINVREQPEAMVELEALGVRSVPVVARNSEYVFAQELRDVARFVGVTMEGTLLSKEVLIRKLDLVLAAAQRYLEQLPSNHLNDTLPGRNRSYLDLVHHLFTIPIAFLDAARGGELTVEHFERKPPSGMCSVNDVARFGQQVRANVRLWWDSVGEIRFLDEVNTYYGRHDVH
ncbi:MAG: glutaredoxin family protein [Steroidobacteraceae bacterium]